MSDIRTEETLGIDSQEGFQRRRLYRSLEVEVLGQQSCQKGLSNERKRGSELVPISLCQHKAVPEATRIDYGSISFLLLLLFILFRPFSQFLL